MTDPISPQPMGGAATPGEASRVVLSGDHAFVLESRTDDHESGLRVIDITDPAAPMVVGGVETPGIARGLAIAGGNAYVAADSLGLQVIDISDPTNPRIVGGA